MSQLHRAQTVVFGLGNLIYCDDAVGVHAARRLQCDHRVPRDVAVIEGHTLGLDLLPYAARAHRLLLLDAVDVGAPPGTLLRFAGPDLHELPVSDNVHQVAVADLLSALRVLGREPQETVLLGIQPGNTALGTILSAPVEAALERLVEAAVEELRRWAESPVTDCEAAAANGPSLDKGN